MINNNLYKNIKDNEINKSLQSGGDIGNTIKIIQRNVNVLNDKIDLTSAYSEFIDNTNNIKLDYNSKGSLTCMLQILVLIMMQIAFNFIHNSIILAIMNLFGIFMLFILLKANIKYRKRMNEKINEEIKQYKSKSEEIKKRHNI